MTQRAHRTGPKWTAAEDEVLLDAIGRNPTNLKASFLAASTELPIRTPGACAQRWYGTLAKDPNVIGKITVGRHAVVKNKTRLTEAQELTHRRWFGRVVWDKIINLIYGNSRG